jgi:hypothetical protein
MKHRLTILLFHLALSKAGFSQLINHVPTSPSDIITYRTQVYVTIAPSWNPATNAIRKMKSVSTDSVFMYRSKKKNKDSTLVMVQFFDTLGNLLKRDQYSLHGEFSMREIFTYEDKLLMRKDEVKGSSSTKQVTTYQYDSAGHVVRENFYNNYKDDLQNEKTTIYNKIYDEFGHVAREFVTYPNQPMYLLREYLYNVQNQLTEIKSFNYNGEVSFSYLHEYDMEERTESVFRQFGLNEKEIQNDFAYDKQYRLIMSKNYTQGQRYLKHSTQTFVYSSNNLVDSQIYQDTERNNYYYKHFYTYTR